MQDIFHKIELLGTIAGEINVEELLNYIENNAKMTKVVFDCIISNICDMDDPAQMRRFAQKAIVLRSKENKEMAMVEALSNKKIMDYIDKNADQFHKILTAEIDQVA